ncbi:MAG: hydantoinase/oxoprolinase family protein [Promethearchaeota archaeon]
MKKKLFVAFDIGGVNIKCSSIANREIHRLIHETFSTKTYFPLWKNSIFNLKRVLREIMEKHLSFHLERENMSVFDVHVCSSITGELSDAFDSKKEGIHVITTALDDAIEEERTLAKIDGRFAMFQFHDALFVGLDGILYSKQDAINNHRKVSAANWYATARWVASFIEDGILLDCGSTTTDIIPIISNEVQAIGASDLERLQFGELVYTGMLRSTIPSIAHEVPVNDILTPISFEKFSIIADAHLILNNINEEDYDCETADGRPKDVIHAMKRLSRIVCEDFNKLGEKTIIEIARFLIQKQREKIEKGVNKVLGRLKEQGIIPSNLACIVTGLGEKAILLPIASGINFKVIKPLSEIIGFKATISSSSIGALYMLMKHVEKNVEKNHES